MAPTPDLTAENGSAASADLNENGSSTSSDDPVFSDGKASNNNGNHTTNTNTNANANGNNANNAKHGNGSKKKKKKKQAKNTKSRTTSPITIPSSDTTTMEYSTLSATSPSNANGSMDNGDHKHARDPSIDARPMKKQRNVDQTMLPRVASNASHVVLFAIFFILGMFVTLPLLFSTGTIMNCGGRSEVNSMVDEVLVRKNRGVATLDMMQHFGRDQKMRSKRKKGSSESESNNESPTLNESMCHVASIAIGHFVHYLPYAQVLVLRNPSIAIADVITSLEANEIEERAVEIESKRKGMLQRVLSKHKKKHEADNATSNNDERNNRKHPLRHILEGASLFSHHRKEKKERKRREKELRKQQLRKQNEGGDNDDDGEIEVDWKKWKYAMSDDYELKSDEISLIKELTKRIFLKAKMLRACKDANVTVIDECSEDDTQIISLSGGSNMTHKPLHERLDSVSWGGIDSLSTAFWQKQCGKDLKKVSAHCEGGRLLTAHLKIMQWPSDLHVKYPFRLCAKGCESEVSILHTLEWREKFKPWCMSNEAVKFNDEGFIYHRGHSRAGPVQRIEASKSGDQALLSNAGHSMVWYRLGLASASENPDLYMRSMINALDGAVADSLVRNKGTIGRFNVVMDCAGMTSKHSPSIANVKKLFSVLQDHFPDRLGVLLAANLSGLTQMLMKMVLPFVTEDVRAKIHIIPNDPEERRLMLSQFMEEEEVPYYLGGKDEHRFDAEEYFKGKCILPEEGILEYKTTMPYHA